jgi:8-oxo-dGTP pyrophosphatase MutT (NUDIX family)
MGRNENWPERFSGHEFPQIIPDPEDVRAGGPAPWAKLDIAKRSQLQLSTVLENLSTHGRSLRTSSIPETPLEIAVVADADRQPITRKSAVLAALFEESGETHVVLTRRSQALRNHRGEISFPGGASEPDETPIQTALRETFEEVGIEPHQVNPVAWLSPIVTFASGSAIWPIVGVLAQPPHFTINPAEVDRAFSVSLAELLADGSFLQERWRRSKPRPGADEEGYFPIYFYRVPGDLIWGATARMLTELLCLATGVEWPDAHRVWS